MITIVEILGKKVRVESTVSADNAMNKLEKPLLVEMELLFSCLIRKAVRFKSDADPVNYVAVTPKLKIRFRPVTTKVCLVSDVLDSGVPLQDFPLKKPAAFVPRQLFIDYKRGVWRGEFQIPAAEAD
ncbi:MAG: hypothetical protein ACYC0M_01615 [Burkholderiales bacterium]